MASDSFLFDPVSLVLSKGRLPHDTEKPGRVDDEFARTLPVIDFLARYLHERVHWIQHFSTFAGLLSLFRVEMQTRATIDLLSTLADDRIDVLPLRTHFANNNRHIEGWNALELLDATLCGDRSRAHFEGSYGREWGNRVLAGARIFSSVMYCLPGTSFSWPTLEQLTVRNPLTIRNLIMVDDGRGFVSGAAAVAEIHAWSAQILKLSNFLERESGDVLAIERMISARASSLRSSFYERARLEDGWRAEVLCSQAAFYALNAPVALFFPPPSIEKEDLMSIAPIAHFLSLADKIGKAPLAQEPDVPEDVSDFLKWSKSYLDRLIGFDLFEYNLTLLQAFAESAAYSPASSDTPKSLHLDDSLRLSFLGSFVAEMVKAARAEPMFVMCPGHLYELNRPRFQKLFGAVGNFLEHTEGIGYMPAPYFSRKMDAAEYTRHVAFGVQADVARAMMVRGRSELNRLLSEYSRCHEAFRSAHLAGVHIGLQSLKMPLALYRELRDQVPLPDC